MNENIAKRFTEYRKAAGLSQGAVAEKLGVSRQAVSKWERGLSKPCDEHLVQLVNLLALPVESPISTNVKPSNPHSTFISTIRKEFIRILTTGTMRAVSIYNLAGKLSIDSTVVYLGFSVALFCFGTMIKG